jgi:arginine N-succinyltransferase
LLRLAEAAGPGLTNLPPDRVALEQRIAASNALLDAHGRGGGAILLLLEIDGQVGGTGMIFPLTGVDWPFYSYRITHMTQRTRIEERDVMSVGFHVLTLTNDLDGCTEVGGLMIDPAMRRGALGRMMARSRYLFIARHRDWFARRTIADLRGWLHEGSSPFWDAVGRRFYRMEFDDADRVNGMSGNQFIADLGPRYPIYVNMLSPEAQAAIGRVHDDGQGALAMLREEGFSEQGYVDIFDAGPTIIAETDALKAVANARHATIRGFAPDGIECLIGAGEATAFRCVRGLIDGDGAGVAIDRNSAEALGVGIGATIIYTAY